MNYVKNTIARSLDRWKWDVLDEISYGGNKPFDPDCSRKKIVKVMSE